jgi:hypothetical protein
MSSLEPYVIHCSINDTTVSFVTAAIEREDPFADAGRNGIQMYVCLPPAVSITADSYIILVRSTRNIPV